MVGCAGGEKQIPCGDDNKKGKSKGKGKGKSKGKGEKQIPSGDDNKKGKSKGKGKSEGKGKGKTKSDLTWLPVEREIAHDAGAEFVDRVRGGDVEGLAVVAPGEVGGDLGEFDLAEDLAFGRKDADAAGA